PGPGVVPRAGARPSAAPRAGAGPRARAARDAALVHAVLSGTRLAGSPGKAMRIGVPDALLGRSPPDRDMAARFDEAIAALRRAGHEVRRVVLPSAELFNACSFVVARAEAHARWGEALRGAWSSVGAIARRSLAIGAFLDPGDFARAARLRVVLRAGFDALMDEVDLLCLPTMPGEAGPIDPDDAVTRADTAPYTRPFSLVGAPAISMPCGAGGHGLPLGLQFVGPRGGDAALLAFACALEDDPAWPWRAEIPEAFAWN
ncbi:MAG: amidase family protein, partial [Alphaproteobacteria bacterium]